MTFFSFQKIMGFFISAVIYFILIYSKTYKILKRISDFLLLIITLVNKDILLIADVLFS